MRDLNKSIFTGRLTADPELRYLSSNGMACVNTSVAVNSVRGTGDQRKDHVDYVEVTIYGKTAENVAKYMRKGSPVLIDGKLSQQRWADKATGANRSKLGIVADSVLFLGQGAGSESGESRTRVPGPIGDAFPDAAHVDEGDIPF